MRLLSDDRCLPRQAPGHRPPNSGMHGCRGVWVLGVPTGVYACVSGARASREGGRSLLFSVSLL